jgi:hypothetical protein
MDFDDVNFFKKYSIFNSLRKIQKRIFLFYLSVVFPTFKHKIIKQVDHVERKNAKSAQ